jgi:hypothetical protein
MKGDYKLLRQGGGRGAFAHVFVEITLWAGAAHQVSVYVDPNDTATLAPEQDPTWFEAAIAGCHRSMQTLEASAVVQRKYHVRITALHVNLVDTQADAITAAAYLAVAAAFQAQDRFQLVFSDQWHVLPV